MSWTTAGDLSAQLRRRWDRGELLRESIIGESGFPLRLRLRGPGSSELADRFEAVRAWVAGLVAVPHVRIEWREVKHRVLGAQRLPQAVWVDTLEDALALIGKRGEAARFAGILAQTRARQPALLDWLARRPLQAVGLAADWGRLLAVVDWLIRHPRPRIYLRQVDLPGVHTKFIEAHRGVLCELLDLALPAEAIDAERVGAARFAARYGFLEKPARIRLRVLDARIPLLPGPTQPDLTLDAGSFARLHIPVRRVFITENETNFLAFPPVPDAIILFGAGYGWEALAKAQWLAACDIHYWGDIDTHGFAILDRLRTHFDRAASFLMDRPTLMSHEALWGEEPDQIVQELPRLTGPERALFDDLRDNRIRPGLRLEQERVGFDWVQTAIARVIGAVLTSERAADAIILAVAANKDDGFGD